MRTRTLLAVAAAAIVAVACGVTITRGPDFHHYADARTWLGIPHPGDVLSNLAFVAAALLAGRRRTRLGQRRGRCPDRQLAVRTSDSNLTIATPSPFGGQGTDGPSAARDGASRHGLAYFRAARAGVVAIGIGSGIYHLAPRDLPLVFDWAPIALTLVIVTAAVAADRAGARAGAITLCGGATCALAAVAWWYATGGTHGGNMAPYVAVQAAGVALPPLLAVTTPGNVPVRWLVAAVGAFALARVCAAHDRALLEALGVSGHALKHLVAAVAAACALRGLSAARPSPSP